MTEAERNFVAVLCCVLWGVVKDLWANKTQRWLSGLLGLRSFSGSD